MKEVSFQIKLERELHSEIKKQAIIEDISMGEFFRRSVRKELKKVKKNK